MQKAKFNNLWADRTDMIRSHRNLNHNEILFVACKSFAIFVLKIFAKEFYLCLRAHSKSTALKFIKLGDVLLRVRLKYFYAHAPHRCGGAVMSDDR